MLSKDSHGAFSADAGLLFSITKSCVSQMGIASPEGNTTLYGVEAVAFSFPESLTEFSSTAFEVLVALASRGIGGKPRFVFTSSMPSM